jgi:S1-C subfamily serine protease
MELIMKIVLLGNYKKQVLLFLMMVVLPLQKVAAEFNAVELTEQIKTSAERVRPAVVSIYSKGWGTGIVISSDGLIATAGHMLMSAKTNDVVVVTFSDGREVDAKPLGYNLVNDTALLKIQAPATNSYPFVQMQKEIPVVGDFCFTLAHPAGLKKGRPAQLRLGRITIVQQKDGHPWLYFSDTEIQPGDSGGPLFSTDGRLIGIDSSAAGIRRFNRFATVERLNADMDKLVAGERMGSLEDGPTGSMALQISMENSVITNLINEFKSRVQSSHRPTIEFVTKLAGESGQLNLDPNTIINFMVPDVYAEKAGVPYGMGLADPKLIAQLPALPVKRPTPLPVFVNGQFATYAVRINEHYFVAKMSKITASSTNIVLQIGKHEIPLLRRAENKENDVVLLEITTSNIKINTPGLQLTDAGLDIKAGDGLIAVDANGLIVWGAASDSIRSVKERITIGPLNDEEELISKRRANFPAVIAHGLRLYDQDTGVPVFDFKGNCIGIHHARLSRTIGLILPVDVLHEIIPSMIHDSESM